MLELFLAAVLSSACAGNPIQTLKPVKIEGAAMSPAFNDGDRVLLDTNILDLKRGDVVRHLYPKDRSKSYLKRIIGLPGETIEMRAGKIFVDNQFLDEPYVLESNNNKKQTFAPVIVAENNYYVLGDNRDNSSDSRYWGTVERDLIKGRFYLTYSKAGE